MLLFPGINPDHGALRFGWRGGGGGGQWAEGKRKEGKSGGGERKEQPENGKQRLPDLGLAAV
jgi:hypothetical protein